MGEIHAVYVPPVKKVAQWQIWRMSHWENLFWGEALGIIHGWLCFGVKSFLAWKVWRFWIIFSFDGKRDDTWVLAGCILTLPVTWIQMCSPPAAVRVLDSVVCGVFWYILSGGIVFWWFEKSKEYGYIGYILSVGIVFKCFQCRYCIPVFWVQVLCCVVLSACIVF